MGTVVSFLVDPGELAPGEVGSAIQRACDELHLLDERFSLWKPESELSKMRAGEIDAPSSLMDEVLELCAVSTHLSQGFFDPWSMPGGFDPTGLVKGWAAERALSILGDSGAEAAVVNAGGDVCVLPGRSYDIGIRHPADKDALCGVVSVVSAVATSGVYERGDHLLNPFDGDIAAVSATVIGGRLAIADALATALAVGGKDVLYLLEGLEGFEGFFVTAAGALFKTSGMAFAKAVEDKNTGAVSSA